MRKETLDEKIARVVAEEVSVVPYDPRWPELYRREADHLRQCLPGGLILRMEHFGSTAVPGLAAKPVVDMVIEIADELLGKRVIPEILEPQGYDCFWRPEGNIVEPPFFTWCIRRNEHGERTHHLHFVVPGFKDRELAFRDLLRSDPDLANRYGELKLSLCESHANDRIAYTEAKGDFIRRALSNAASPRS